MKKSFEIKKNILKYILIFILVIFVALRLLIITAKIPKQAISKNMKESVGFFKEHIGIDEIQKRREYTSIHYYADSILLNIIYIYIYKSAPETEESGWNVKIEVWKMQSGGR